MLTPRAERHEHAILGEPDRVGDEQAGEVILRHARQIGQAAARRGRRIGGLGDIDRREDIGAVNRRSGAARPHRRREGARSERVAILLQVDRSARIELVADAADVELAADARLPALVAVLAGHEQARAGAGTRRAVGDRDRRIFTRLAPVAEASGGIDHHVVDHIDLDPRDPIDVPQLGVAPFLPVIASCIGHVRHDDAGVEHADLRAWLERLLILVTEVEEEAARPAAEIEARAQHLHAALFVVDRAVAVAIDAVDAHAEAVVRSEARARIEIAAENAVGAVAGRRAEQGLFGALGDQVDAAANAGAARRRAEQEGVGAVQHLDSLIEFGRHDLARGDAEQPVHRHIVPAQREAADHEQFGLVAEAEGGAHRRIVLQHVADRLGLLIEHELRGVGGDVERRLQRALVTQHADIAAAHDLLLCLLRGDDDVVRCLLRPGRGRDQGGTSGQQQRRLHSTLRKRYSMPGR